MVKSARIRFWLFAGLVLLAIAFPSPSRAETVRYTTTTPAADWPDPKFDDSAWKTAPSLAEVATPFQTAPEIWVRLHQQMTYQQINGSYFTAAHGGALAFYVNGKRRVDDPKPSAQEKVYTISPLHDEAIGANVFALHATAGADGSHLLKPAHVIGEWVPVEDRKVKPRPIFPEVTRDAEVCLAPDHNFYLTATCGSADFFFGPKFWMVNDGLKVFRSPDLKRWTSLGWVWTFDRDGTWNKDFGKIGERSPARGIFAPEISYHQGKYWLVYSVNHTTARHRNGIGLLHADKPEGPYIEVSPDKPLIDAAFDPDLFEDDDGKVYLIHNGCVIQKLKDDMSGLDGPPTTLIPTNYPYIGYEGPCIFKANGKYYVAAADWCTHADGTRTYDVMVASSDHLLGPYGPRSLAIRWGGHNGFWHDAKGQWYATVWSIPESDHHITIVKVDLLPDGRVQPALEDCEPGPYPKE